jgi:hypothetical protein
MANALRDKNRVPTILGVSSVDGTTPIRVKVNPNTGAMLIDGASLVTDLDTVYLRLDATNDPLTGSLTIGDDHFLNIDGSAVFNETGAAVNFRVESDGNANMIFVDGTNNRVGIGTGTPDETFHVVGNFQVDNAETATKGYRFRTSGTNLDLDAAVANLFISTYTGAGFTGTQRQYIEFGAEFEFEKHYKKTIWDGTGGDFIVFDKDGTSVFNEQGLDRDFRFETDTITSALFLDASNDALHCMNSTTGKLSFYGATATTRPTGVAVSAAGIHAALVTLGLITA